MNRKQAILTILLTFVLLILSTHAKASRRQVIVPAYNIPPLFIYEDDGKVSGIGYDLLSVIAERENWDLKIIKQNVPELIPFMEDNRDPNISIITLLADTDKRREHFDYSEESIVTLCGTLIANKKSHIDNLTDLNNTVIGVNAIGSSSIVLKELLDKLQIKCKIIKLQSFKSLMDFTAENPGSASLLNNLTLAYYQSINDDYDKLISTILLLPSFNINFAVRKDMDSDVLQILNTYLSKWKTTPNSPYKEALETWNLNPKVKTGILSQLTTTQILIPPIILIALVLWILLLRYQVKANTIKIKAKEQDLQATLMSIGDGVIVSNPEGSILEINPIAKKMLSLLNHSDIEHFNALTDLDLYSNDTDNHGSNHDNPIAVIFSNQSNLNHTGTCLLINKKGRQFTINYSASPILITNQLKGVVFVFKDISEEARKSKMIRESERQLSLMLESVNEAVLVFDTSLTITHTNRLGKEILYREYDIDDPINLNIMSIANFQDLPKELKLLNNVMNTGHAMTSTKSLHTGFIYQILTTPILNEEGKTIKIIQSLIDITELKAKETALKTSEQKYRLLIENQSDLIIKLSLQGEILFATESFNAFFNISPDDTNIKKYFDFIDPEDLERARSSYYKFLDHQQNILIELRHQTHTGLHWISWKLSKVFDDENNMQAIIGTGRDITDAKVANEQLKHVQKLEAIGQLAGGIAHDFNNMLGGIVGFAELINLQSKPDSTIRTYSRNIINTSEKAAELTQQLLSFARKGKSASTPIDAHSSIRRAVDILKRSIKKNISIELLLNAQNSMITGDPTQIQNIILNLGINARDAIGDEGGGTFSIETTTIRLTEEYCQESDFDLTPQEYLLIKAIDNGSGMEEETLKHIFEPFFTTKDIGKGTGLGLASIFGAVTSHSGAITVSSELGYGTEFDIFLPLINIENRKTEEGNEESTDYFSIVSQKDHKVVLVIDDEEVIRMVAKSILENIGYEVILAQDGQEGIEAFKVNKDIISLVILDVIMPRMAGKETLLALQEIDPDVKVIMASGYAQKDKREDFLKLGAREFIHKPYRQKELFAILDKVLLDNTQK